MTKNRLAIGEKIELVCSGDGNPSPNFRWEVSHPNYTEVQQSHWEFKGEFRKKIKKKHKRDRFLRRKGC